MIFTLMAGDKKRYFRSKTKKVKTTTDFSINQSINQAINQSNIYFTVPKCMLKNLQGYLGNKVVQMER